MSCSDRLSKIRWCHSSRPSVCFSSVCNNSRDGRRRLARPPYQAWVSGRAAVLIPAEVRGEVTADDFSLKLQNQHLITAVGAECSRHFSNEEVVGLFWSRKLIKRLKFHVQPELFWVCSPKRRVTLKKKERKHFVFTLNSRDKEPMFICIPRIRKPFFFSLGIWELLLNNTKCFCPNPNYRIFGLNSKVTKAFFIVWQSSTNYKTQTQEQKQ